jgi:DNA-binding response OmpR family regulator
MRRGGEAVRRELLAEVWGYQENVTSRTVDTHYGGVAPEDGARPDEPGYIMTIAKRDTGCE